MPPSSTSDAPGTPASRAATRPAVQLSAVAERAALRPQRVEHDRLQRGRRPRRRPRAPNRSRRPATRRSAASSAASGWRITTSISARERADGRLGAAGVAAEVLERVGDRSTRARRTCAAPCAAARRPAAAPPAGWRRPSATSAPARPAARAARRCAGRRPARSRRARCPRAAAPRRRRARWPACGSRARSRSDRRPRARANSATIASICASVGSSSTSSTPATRRHAGHGAVVVRRPEAAGGEHQVDAALRAAPTAPRRSRPRGRRRRRSAPAARRVRRARAPGNDEFVSTVRPIRISEPVTRTAARTWVTRSA